MVKIKSVWSSDMGLHVELENGEVFAFRTQPTDTKEMVLERIKKVRDLTFQRWKARERKELDPSLKHLKELEGEEVE